MTSPSKSPAEEARDDIFAEFEMWGTKFEPDGRLAAEKVFNDSLGRYLNELTSLNPNVALWSKRELKELSTFILGYVIAEIAVALRLVVDEGKLVNAKQIEHVALNVMGAPRTVVYCGVIIRSYHKKVAHPADPTPICFAQYLLD